MSRGAGAEPVDVGANGNWPRKNSEERFQEVEASVTQREQIGHEALRGVACAAVGLAMMLGSGCVVGQRPGVGRCVHLYEATTRAPYWLYLPAGYDDPDLPTTQPSCNPLAQRPDRTVLDDISSWF